MITEGSTKIIGGGNSFLMYLVHKHPKIQLNFYSEEQRSEVDRLLNWFQSRMRPCSSRLIRMVVQPRVFQQPEPSKAAMKTSKEEFFDMQLKSLEECLKKDQYFSGEKMTVVDIMFYCEIRTVLYIY